MLQDTDEPVRAQPSSDSGTHEHGDNGPGELGVLHFSSGPSDAPAAAQPVSSTATIAAPVPSQQGFSFMRGPVMPLPPPPQLLLPMPQGAPATMSALCITPRVAAPPFALDAQSLLQANQRLESEVAFLRQNQAALLGELLQLRRMLDTGPQLPAPPPTSSSSAPAFLPLPFNFWPGLAPPLASEPL